MGSPTEILPGESSDRYALVIGAILGAILVGGTFLAYLVDSSRDPQNLYPIRDAALNAMTWNIVVIAFLAAFILLVAFYPHPAGHIELSPYGIHFANLGVTRFVPWSQVHVVGRMLYVVVRWEGVPSRFKMAPGQVARVTAYLSWARSLPPPAT